MKLNMSSFATVREAIDAINKMSDDMAPFGIVTMGEMEDMEEGEGVNVETEMEQEIPEGGMAESADVEEFYPEEEVYS